MGPAQRVKHRTIPSASTSRNRALHQVPPRATSVLDEGPQPARTARMTQLAERFRLDLADALAGDGEAPTDLLQGVIGTLADPEAQPDDLLLARRQGGEDLLRLVLEVTVHHHL